MPLAPDPPFPKTQGDNIRSKDWNDAISEIVRLDNAKANRNNAETFSGPLTVGASIRSGNLSMGPWPANASFQFVGVSTLDQTQAGNYALLQAAVGADLGMTFLNSPKSLRFRIGNTDRASVEPDGTFKVFGPLQVGSNIVAGSLTLGPWPNNANYQMVGVSTLNQSLAGNYALLQSATGSDLGTTFLNSPETLRLRIRNADRAVLEKDGSFTLGLAANPVRFTSAWSGFPDAATNQAEVSNDTANYKTLMIVGNKSAGLGRRVSVWDRLEVNGQLIVTSGHTIKLGVPSGPYGNDGIRGEPNLFLDAAGTVYIKQGFQARGMDVAERFAVQGEVREGQVVVYDEVAGAVRACSRAYDAKAVGIVSEAPAFILGLDKGDAPVALCGRVPCWVDADIAAIEAGDLLVSSATPGHAQKLVDSGRARGCVIGKALESLASGRARILAFVLAA